MLATIKCNKCKTKISWNPYGNPSSSFVDLLKGIDRESPIFLGWKRIPQEKTRAVKWFCPNCVGKDGD